LALAVRVQKLAVLALQACLQIGTVMTIRHARLAGTPEEAVDTTFSAPELIGFLALHLVVANGALLGAGLLQAFMLQGCSA